MSSLVTIRSIIIISWISNKQLIRRTLGLPGCESLVGVNGLWGHGVFALAVDWKWAAENLWNQLQRVNIVTTEHSMGHLKEERLMNALSYYAEQLKLPLWLKNAVELRHTMSAIKYSRFREDYKW